MTGRSSLEARSYSGGAAETTTAQVVRPGNSKIIDCALHKFGLFPPQKKKT